MRRSSTKWKSQDNSHFSLKQRLREWAANEVGARLCFDLFCGTGFWATTVWAPRFERVVCVDRAAKQLEEFPELENAKVYCGDNRKLLTGLLVKFGWPDVFDLDAYGWPDPVTHAILASGLCDKRFAIIGTNGGMTCRHRGSQSAVPECWGYGRKVSFAQVSAGYDAWLLQDYCHLAEWADAGRKRIVDFRGYPIVYRVSEVSYWAALVEPVSE